MTLPKKTFLPRKRYRTAFYVACVASIVSVILAIAPAFHGNAQYDPTLAVLTATLISLVWYTYFTYKAVNKDPPTILDFGFSYQKSPASMSLSIQNQRHHHVSCAIAFSIITANGEWPLPPPYTGQKEDKILLKPGEAFHGSVQVDSLIASLPENQRSIIVTAKGIWEDEVGEEGVAGPKSWTVDIEKQTVRRLYSKSEVDAEILKIKKGVS